MRRPGAAAAAPRPRPRVARLVCLLLTAAAALSALHATLGPLPALPLGTPCADSLVLVRNAKYLTRGNVGHWGYALFGLHAALAAAAPPPGAVTLFFDARVTAGDWVRAMVAALERRHGVQIALETVHRAGRCASRDAGEERSSGGGGVWARLDANEAQNLLSGREDALRQAWRDTCGIAPPEGPPAADVLIFNRRPESTRRLCDLQPVTDLLAARGLTWQYAEVPKGACEQVAVLSQPRRFVITPHGAHEVNLFAVWPNATVVEVMPRYTDIPIYNKLVSGTVWVVSEALEGAAFPCRGGVCAPLPAGYGACTRNTLCRKWARNRPCVRPNLAALAAVLDGGYALTDAEVRARAMGAGAAARAGGRRLAGGERPQPGTQAADAG